MTDFHEKRDALIAAIHREESPGIIADLTARLAQLKGVVGQALGPHYDAPSEVEALIADIRAYIESTSEECGYGFSRPANPHDFSPDAECCMPEEIAAHKAACEAYDKGEYTPERGSEWIGKAHILRAPWGIGSYTYRDETASALLARIDARQPAIAPAATPAGWVLVPVSPTLEMTEAGRDARLAGATNMDSLCQWRAMLKAAPTPPA